MVHRQSQAPTTATRGYNRQENYGEVVWKVWSLSDTKAVFYMDTTPRRGMPGWYSGHTSNAPKIYTAITLERVVNTNGNGGTNGNGQTTNPRSLKVESERGRVANSNRDRRQRNAHAEEKAQTNAVGGGNV